MAPCLFCIFKVFKYAIAQLHNYNCHPILMHLPMSLILDVSSKFIVVVVAQLTEQVRAT